MTLDFWPFLIALKKKITASRWCDKEVVAFNVNAYSTSFLVRIMFHCLNNIFFIHFPNKITCKKLIIFFLICFPVKITNWACVFVAKYNNAFFLLSPALFQEKAEEIGVSCSISCQSELHQRDWVYTNWSVCETKGASAALKVPLKNITLHISTVRL